MPSELRHLLFRPREVLEAVTAYHRRLGTTLPAGSVVTCGPQSSGPGSAVRFHITLAADRADGAPFKEGARQNVIIEGEALAAALILFCRYKRIPLPASASKSLQLFGDQLCLLATIPAKPDDCDESIPLRL